MFIWDQETRKLRIRGKSKSKLNYMMQSPPQDFKWSVVKWSSARRKFSSQLETLRTLVSSEHPDMLIVVDLPRHHAKKLEQQSWAKDYYISKEARAMTTKRATTLGIPPPISVVFCRYPFYSEQWFPLTDNSIAQVAEVCIPINAWHPDRSPIPLLQEYQISYDEVSIVTFVIANQSNDVEQLRDTFTPTKVRNAVFYILSPDQAQSDLSIVDCGTDKLSVEFQSHQLWRINEGGSRYAIAMSSILASSAADEDSI